MARAWNPKVPAAFRNKGEKALRFPLRKASYYIEGEFFPKLALGWVESSMSQCSEK